MDSNQSGAVGGIIWGHQMIIVFSGRARLQSQKGARKITLLNEQVDTGQGEQGRELGEYGRKERTFWFQKGKDGQTVQNLNF